MLCVVDYAHTPDALERAIAAMRAADDAGRLIVVFGCGGDRDRGKRPMMGEIAARDADLAIVTSDNPRTEDPAAIVDMILDGVRRTSAPKLAAGELGAAPRAATTWRSIGAPPSACAAAAAAPGDVLLIAGKGHEDYQIVGTTKHHFDDREEAAAALAADGSRRPRPKMTAAAPRPSPFGLGGARDGRHDRRRRGRAGARSRARATTAAPSRPGSSSSRCPGERVDGFDFAAQAAAAGAAGIVVARARGIPAGCDGVAVIAVDDPRRALGDAGARGARRVHGAGRRRHRLERQDHDQGAVRRGAAARSARCCARAGSFNTDVGLPLTILSATGNEAAWVLEMAMRGRGEIAYLAEVARPTSA